ncbi:hypothetical protein DICA3_D16842 [Diutina catenulata]
MQLTIFAALIATAFAGQALKEEVGLAVNSDGYVTVGGDNKVELVLNDDSQLANKASGKYIVVQPDGIVAESDSPAEGSWTADGYLDFTAKNGVHLSLLQCQNTEGDLIVSAIDKNNTPKNSCSDLVINVQSSGDADDVKVGN